MLRQAIARGEEQLQIALKDLVRAAETRASVGHYVARYPWHFVVAGLVLGGWLGRRRGGGPKLFATSTTIPSAPSPVARPDGAAAER